MDYWKEKAVRLHGDGYILSKRRPSILQKATLGRLLFFPALRVASNLITPENSRFAQFLRFIIEKYGMSRHWQMPYPPLLLLFNPPPANASVHWQMQWQLNLPVTGAASLKFHNFTSNHSYHHHTVTPDSRRTFLNIPESYRYFLTRTESTYLKVIPFIFNRNNIERNINQYDIENRKTSLSHAPNWPELYFTSFFGDFFGDREDIRENVHETNRFLFDKTNGKVHQKTFDAKSRNTIGGILRQFRPLFFQSFFSDTKLLTTILRKYRNRTQSFLSKKLLHTESNGIMSTDYKPLELFDYRYEQRNRDELRDKYPDEKRHLRGQEYIKQSEIIKENGQSQIVKGKKLGSEPELKTRKERRKGNDALLNIHDTKSLLFMSKPVTTVRQAQSMFRAVNAEGLFVLNGLVDFKQTGKLVNNNSGLQPLVIKPLIENSLDSRRSPLVSLVPRQESVNRYNSAQLSNSIYRLRTFPFLTTDQLSSLKQIPFAWHTWLSNSNRLFLLTTRDKAIVGETIQLRNDYTFPVTSAERSDEKLPIYIQSIQKDILNHKQIVPAPEGFPIPEAKDDSRESGRIRRDEPRNSPSDILLEQIKEQIKSRTGLPAMSINHSSREIGMRWKKDVFQSAAGSVDLALVKRISQLDADGEELDRQRYEGTLEDDVRERTFPHLSSVLTGKNGQTYETVRNTAWKVLKQKHSRNPLTYLNPRKADIGVLNGRGVEKTGGAAEMNKESTGQDTQTYFGSDMGTTRKREGTIAEAGVYSQGAGSPKYQAWQEGPQPLQDIEKLIDMNRLADRLYRMLERKIRDEKERRGR